MISTRAETARRQLLSRRYLPALILLVCPCCGPTSTPEAPPSAGQPEVVRRSPRVESEPDVAIADLRALSDENNRFALDLYSRLRTEPSDDLFFSPLSLSTALAMAYAGARDQTAEQMGRVLHFRLPPEKLSTVFGALRRSWQATDRSRRYRLDVANRLWCQEGFDILPEFRTVTRKSFGAEAATVNFAGPTDEPTTRINAWVEEQTQGKIRDLIPPGSLARTTRLVLTSVVYFKGRWTQTFQKQATELAPFHVSARQQASIPLMSATEDFRYRTGDGLKVLELPYGEGDLAMVVLLPDEIEGLSSLEAKLTADSLSRWSSGLSKRKVRVYLPRFTLTSQFRLAELLKAMGMTRAFTPGEANFAGISQQDLFLSVVVHKAFVDVNEEGTEAAAATAVEAKSEGAEFVAPAVFRADHPFVFLIRDIRTGSILLLGRFLGPKGS